LKGKKILLRTVCGLMAAFSPLNGRAQQAKSAGESTWVIAGGLRLKVKLYESERISKHPRLIMILHGDSPFGPPSYQYAFARRVAAQFDDVVAAAILRPGYSDDTGDKSDGERGLTTGDNYTPLVIDVVADAIHELKLRFHPAITLLVGHSGGAAISADLLGAHPSTAQAALLISCPCDLVAWRQHMFEAQRDPIWQAPIESLSPIDLAGRVSPAAQVRLLVGSDDPIAPPALTEAYAAALRKRGVSSTVTVAPGLKHDILLEPVASDELKKLLRSVATQPKP
jgi:pimeloyl-ACP methyl ester carboxylesterase